MNERPTFRNKPISFFYLRLYFYKWVYEYCQRQRNGYFQSMYKNKMKRWSLFSPLVSWRCSLFKENNPTASFYGIISKWTNLVLIIVVVLDSHIIGTYDQLSLSCFSRTPLCLPLFIIFTVILTLFLFQCQTSLSPPPSNSDDDLISWAVAVSTNVS